jgi:hypothetical protein
MKDLSRAEAFHRSSATVGSPARMPIPHVAHPRLQVFKPWEKGYIAPPPTGRIQPVMKEACAEARNAIAAARSSARQRFPKAISRATSSRRKAAADARSSSGKSVGGIWIAYVRDVTRSDASVVWGATSLMRMPYWATSFARDMVRTMTPPLEVAYGTRYRLATACVARLTMAPDRCSIIVLRPPSGGTHRCRPTSCSP